MAQPPSTSVQIEDFPGLQSGRDPLDIPEGAGEEQVNATCVVMGELQVRRGYRQVTFENG